MGYLHINNLYKDQNILLFKECYSLEKIHGTSAHIKWSSAQKQIFFFSGGEKHEKFVNLFDQEALLNKFTELFSDRDITIYGEAYGGKCQGMSHTYGKEFKFIAFDVEIYDRWLNVLKAEQICKDFGIEFVDYVKIPTDLYTLNAEMNKDSAQAIRNGVGPGRPREGVVLRPLEEMILNNGARVISKHKREEFRETKSTRDVDPEKLKILSEASEIAEEWVTEMRLSHILDKMSEDTNVESTSKVIAAMIEDIYREAKGEIVESKDVSRAIGNKTATMFKQKMRDRLK